MENKLDKILDMLDNNKTHPNLAKVWKNYLLLKKNKLDLLLNQCEEIFNSDITITKDLTNENILTLCFLNQS